MSKKERIENLEDHVIQLREELVETKYAVKLLATALRISKEIIDELSKTREDTKEDKEEPFNTDLDGDLFVDMLGGNKVDLGFLTIYLKNKENEGV